MAQNRPTPTPSPRTRRAAAWLAGLSPCAVPIRLRRIGELRFQEISFATPRPHVSGARIASDDTPLLPCAPGHEMAMSPRSGDYSSAVAHRRRLSDFRRMSLRHARGSSGKALGLPGIRHMVVTNARDRSVLPAERFCIRTEVDRVLEDYEDFRTAWNDPNSD